MIVVNTSNNVSIMVWLSDGLLKQHIATRLNINKLTLTYVSGLIVSQLSIAFRIAGILNKPPNG